jgi:hypothetical protein
MDTQNDNNQYSITFEQYEAFCASTAVYRADIAEPYLVLGLCGEIGELIEKYHTIGPIDFAEQLMLELGDAQWYAARLCSGYRLDFGKLARAAIEAADRISYHGSRGTLERLACSAGKIADRVKKRLRDGANWQEGSPELDAMVRVVRSMLIQFLTESILFIRYVNSTRGVRYSYHRVLTMNRDKLQSRKDRGALRGSGDDR